MLRDAAITASRSEGVAIKTVLYASDFSTPAAAVFPYALALAKANEAELVIFHALPPAAFDPQTGFLISRDQMRRIAKEELKRLGRHVDTVRHRLVLREGELWPQLNEFASKEKVDLIVLGTHGRSGVGRLVLGSVAEEILRRASCPVLTLGPKALTVKTTAYLCGMGPRQILYATALTPESFAAASFAVSLARDNQAKLVLLTVLDGLQGNHTSDRERVLGHLRGELEKVVPEDGRFWCRPECAIEFGSTAEKILETSRRLNANLIVMGARSAGDHLFAATHFAKAIIHQVITGAECPVLTVLGQTSERERAGL
jgi:nucleotide-binding universal stress UspA family protein